MELSPEARARAHMAKQAEKRAAVERAAKRAETEMNRTTEHYMSSRASGMGGGGNMVRCKPWRKRHGSGPVTKHQSYGRCKPIPESGKGRNGEDIDRLGRGAGGSGRYT